MSSTGALRRSDGCADIDAVDVLQLGQRQWRETRTTSFRVSSKMSGRGVGLEVPRDTIQKAVVVRALWLPLPCYTTSDKANHETEGIRRRCDEQKIRFTRCHVSIDSRRIEARLSLFDLREFVSKHSRSGQRVKRRRGVRCEMRGCAPDATCD